MLTKTDFLLYHESPLHLWAKAHDQVEAQWQTPLEKHLIQQGAQVEAMARDFVESTLLQGYQTPQVLWQPTYDDGQFQIRADVLIFEPDLGFYDLYEIKSSTRVKREHELDVAFQVLLLEKLLNLRHTYLLHVNPDYIHQDALIFENFFVVEEISEKVEKRRSIVEETRQEAWQVLKMPQPTRESACTKPANCPCPSLCHPNLPHNPVYDLPYIGKKAQRLRAMGVLAIQDIPEDFRLSDRQHRHMMAVKKGQPVIEVDDVQAALDALDYPFYFLDYETFNPALPMYPGYRSYEQIVFQYSLHILQAPDASLQHYDCLITNDRDPAPQLVANLLSHIGPTGSVIVWNKTFEAERNRDLARHCPEKADALKSINDRLYDLMLIFSKGLYVDPGFHGSASLKAVLPVLCPDLSYEVLQISNGEEAMLTWWQLQQTEMSPEQRMAIEKDMLAYCEMDTYALVAILEALFQIMAQV